MSFSEYAKRVRARSESNSGNASGLLERSRKNRALRVIDQANAYQNRIEQYSQGNGRLEDLDTSVYRKDLEKVSDYLDSDTKKNILALYDIGDREIQRVNEKNKAAVQVSAVESLLSGRLENKNNAVSILDQKTIKNVLSGEKETYREKYAQLTPLERAIKLKSYESSEEKDEKTEKEIEALKAYSTEQYNSYDPAKLKAEIYAQYGLNYKSEEENWKFDGTEIKRVDPDAKLKSKANAEYNKIMAEREAASAVESGLMADQEQLTLLKQNAANTKSQEVAEKIAKFGEDNPFLGSVASVLTNTVSFADSPKLIEDNLNYMMNSTTPTGYKEENGQILPDINVTTATQAMRSGVLRNIKSELGKNIYNIGMSILDNAARMGVSAFTGGAGGASQILQQLSFGGNVFSSTVQDLNDRGIYGEDALALGGAAAAIEYATESMDLGRYLGNKSALSETVINSLKNKFTNAFKGAVKGFTAEAAEEIASEILGQGLEYFALGDQSEWGQKYKEMIANGLSKEEAVKSIASDFAKDIVLAGVGGGMGGILFGGVSSLGTGKNDSNTGKAIIDSNNAEAFIELAKQSEDSKVSKFANEISLNSKYSANNLGKLVSLMEQSNNVKTQSGLESWWEKNISQQYAQAEAIRSDIINQKSAGIHEAQKSFANTFTEELTKSGMSEAEADRKAAILSKIMSGADVSPSQIKEVVRTSSTQTRAILEENLGVKLSESNKESVDIIKKLLGPKNAIRNIDEMTAANDDTPIEYRVVNEKNAKNVSVNTKEGEIRLDLTNVGYGATEIVFDTARQITKEGAKQYIGGLSREIKTVGQLKEYTRNFLYAYTVGLSGRTNVESFNSFFRKQMGNKIFSSDAALAAYAAGAKDYQKSKENSATRQKGNGSYFEQKEERVSWGSDVAMTKANKAALEEMARAAGVNIKVVKTLGSIKNADGTTRGINGKYKDGTIYIAKDADNPMLVVAKHELTHYMKEVSRDGYYLYRDFLVQQMMEKRGVKFETLVDRYAAAYRGIPRDDILDEIAADAAELFFTDRYAIKKFANKNKNLGKKILSFVKSLVNGTNATKQYTYMGKELSEYTDVIRKAEKLWVEALSSDTATTSNKQTSGKEKYSISYTTDNKPVVIVEDNILNGVTEDEWIDTVKRTIKDRFLGGIPISGRLIKVNLKTNNEYTKSKYSQRLEKKDKVTYEDKFKAAGHLDEIMLASTNYINEDLNHARRDNFIQFARGDVLFRIGKNDYAAKVIVGFTTGKNMVLYDVIDFRQKTFMLKNKKADGEFAAQLSDNSKSSSNPSTDNTINRNDLSVNSNYMQNSKNNARGANPSIDDNSRNEYNKKGGAYYERTDEFRRIQAESLELSEAELQAFHSDGRRVNGSLRRRLSRVLGEQVVAVCGSGGNGNGLLRLSAKGNEFNIYENVGAELFHDVFEVARCYLENGELVDLHNTQSTADSIGYEDCTNYLSEDGLSGFSITPDGDLISVFNVSGKKGFLRSISNIIKEETKTLDCYASPNHDLPKMYNEIFGFQAASLMDYNMEYDHDNIAANHNKPQVAFMVNTDAEVKTKHFAEDEYEAAVNYRDSYIKSNGIDSRHQIRNEDFENLVEKYGYIVPGENPAREVKVPKQTKDDNKVRKYVRTVMEHKDVTDAMVSDLEQAVVDDLFSYIPTSNESALEAAHKAIERGEGPKLWIAALNKDSISKKDIALGEALLLQAIKDNDRAKVVQLTSEIAALGTRAGQVVQAMSMLKKMTGVGNVVAVNRAVAQIQKEVDKRYKKRAPDLEIEESLLLELAKATDPDDIARITDSIYAQIASQIKSGWSDKLVAWRYLAMLGNLKTHLRNIIGNGLFVPVVRFKNVAQYIVESTPLYQKTREGGRSVSFIISQEYKNFAKADYEIIKEDLASGGKHNPSDAIRNYIRIFNNNTLERIRQFNDVMLEKEDAFFIKRHYIHVLSGYMQAQKIDLNNLSESKMRAIRSYAIQEALEATYRDASAVANAINRLSKKNAFTKMAVEGVLPFKKTPLNILKRGVEYSPLGLVKALVLDVYQVHKGNLTPYEMMNDLSKGITGIGLTLIGMLLTSLGILRGSGGDDKEDRFAELLGYQNYSLEICGKSYTIDWIAPGSLPLFVGVELFNVFDSKYSSIGDYLNSFVSIMDPIYDLSMLQGINTMIESAGFSESTFTTIASTAITSYFSQYIPTAAGQLARSIDGTRRTTYTESTGLVGQFDKMLDKAVNKIPGLSFTGAEYINQWGETESDDGTVADVVIRILENFISPGYANNIEVDEAESLILQLYEATGETSVFPGYTDRTITVDNEEIRLTEAEFNTFAKRKGQLQHKIISDLTSNKSFKALSAADQAELVSTVYTWAGQVAKSEINSDYKLPTSVTKMLEAERRGISNAEFLTIYKTINSYEADKDEEGKTISGSKKAKKVDYIENLTLSRTKKDWLLEEIA